MRLEARRWPSKCKCLGRRPDTGHGLQARRSTVRCGCAARPASCAPGGRGGLATGCVCSPVAHGGLKTCPSSSFLLVVVGLLPFFSSSLLFFSSSGRRAEGRARGRRHDAGVNAHVGFHHPFESLPDANKSIRTAIRKEWLLTSAHLAYPRPVCSAGGRQRARATEEALSCPSLSPLVGALRGLCLSVGWSGLSGCRWVHRWVCRVVVWVWSAVGLPARRSIRLPAIALGCGSGCLLSRSSPCPR